jgi:hypothetical protein
MKSKYVSLEIVNICSLTTIDFESNRILFKRLFTLVNIDNNIVLFELSFN